MDKGSWSPNVLDWSYLHIRGLELRAKTGEKFDKLRDHFVDRTTIYDTRTFSQGVVEITSSITERKMPSDFDSTCYYSKLFAQPIVRHHTNIEANRLMSEVT